MYLLRSSISIVVAIWISALPITYLVLELKNTAAPSAPAIIECDHNRMTPVALANYDLFF